MSAHHNDGGGEGSEPTAPERKDVGPATREDLDLILRAIADRLEATDRQQDHSDSGQDHCSAPVQDNESIYQPVEDTPDDPMAGARDALGPPVSHGGTVLPAAAQAVAANQQVQPEDSATAHSSGSAAIDVRQIEQSVRASEVEADSIWDQAQAEALARAYEEGEADRSVPVPDTMVGAEAAQIEKESVAKRPESAENKPNDVWIDAVVDRLDRVIAAMATNETLDSVEIRLGQLEARVQSSARTLEDFSGAGVRAQLHELGDQLNGVHDKLGRLDSVEQELRLLAARIPEDDVGGDAKALRLSEEDVNYIAEQLGQSIGARAAVSDGLTNSDENGEGDLNAMVRQFISDARDGEEHTNMMLDTMQQALIRLLDRVDDIDRRYIALGGHMPANEVLASADVQSRPTAEAPVPEQVPVADREKAPVADPLASATECDALCLDDYALELERQTAGNELPVAVTLESDIEEIVEKPLLPADSDDAEKPTVETKKTETLEKEPTGDVPAGRHASMVEAARRAAQQAARERANADHQKDDKKLNLFGLGKLFSKSKNKTQKSAAKRRGSRSVIGSIIVVGLIGGFLIHGIFDGGQLRQSMADGRVGELAKASAVVKADGTKAQPAVAKATAPAKTQPVQTSAGDENNTPAIEPVKAALTADGDGRFAASSKSTDRKGVSKLTLPPALIGPLSLRLAAANGDPSAQFEIGARFAEGKGVPQDLDQALKWYQRSASQGFAIAQYRLAAFYERGVGVSFDLERARNWYARAAANGNVKAMHNLGVLATMSQKRQPDYKRAAEWFNKAAMHGLRDSQFNLAILLGSGLGVPRDLILAYKWFALAANDGDEDAKRRLAKTKAELTTAQLAIAKKAVAGWQRRGAPAIANDAHAAGALWQRRTNVRSSSTKR